MKRRQMFSLLCLLLSVVSSAFGADISGKWTASFETGIGVQNYTYEFKVADGKVTGRAESQHGKATITDGTVSGDTVTFTEVLDFQGMEIKINYTGKIDGDEIKFTRQVADIATEELVAKRAK